MKRHVRYLFVFLLLAGLPARGQTISSIIDATGDGAGNFLSRPAAHAADAFGNVYVVGWFSWNAFKITAGGTITEIIDQNGDGSISAMEEWVALVQSLGKQGGSSVTEAADVQAPDSFFLDGNYPNPFSPETTIAWSAARENDVASSRQVWLYWTDCFKDEICWISRARTDEPLEQTLVVDSTFIPGVALDPEAGRMFWTDIMGRVRSAKLDGSDQVTLLVGESDLGDVEADPDEQQLYWVSGLSIVSSRYDGTERRVVAVTAPDKTPTTLATAGNDLFVGTNKTILRMDKATGVTELEYAENIPSPITGLAVDGGAGRIYFSTLSNVAWLTLDGSQFGQVLDTGGTGFTIDPPAGRMYLGGGKSVALPDGWIHEYDLTGNPSASGFDDLVVRVPSAFELAGVELLTGPTLLSPANGSSISWVDAELRWDRDVWPEGTLYLSADTVFSADEAEFSWGIDYSNSDPQDEWAHRLSPNRLGPWESYYWTVDGWDPDGGPQGFGEGARSEIRVFTVEPSYGLPGACYDSEWTSAFEDNFEDGKLDASWHIKGTEGGWGLGQTNPSTGVGSVGSRRSGSQGNPDSGATETWLVYGPLDLSYASRARFRFDRWVKTEECCEQLRWGASIDGTEFALHPPTSGTLDAWTRDGYSLDDPPPYDPNTYLGEDSVWIGFQFFSTQSGENGGVFLDNVCIDLLSTSPDELMPPRHIYPMEANSKTELSAPLRWLRVEDTRSTQYEVQVSTGAGFDASGLVFSASTRAGGIETTRLEAGQTYSWRVRAMKDDGEMGPYSETTSFTTSSSPIVAASLGPYLLSVGHILKIDLDTVFVDPEGDALTYTVQVENAGVLGVVVNGSLLTVEASTVGHGSVTVTAEDPQGASHSEVVYFEVAAVTALDDDAATPLDFALGPIYPNPVNSTASATISLPTISLVTIQIYDVQGRIVSTMLPDAAVIEAGSNLLTFDVSFLASGVYILGARMHSTGVTVSRTMIVTRGASRGLGSDRSHQ